MRINIHIQTEDLLKVAIGLLLFLVVVSGTVFCTGWFLTSAKHDITSVQYRPVIRETYNETHISDPVIINVKAGLTDCIRINGKETSSCS
jgi:hypothetical protein